MTSCTDADVLALHRNIVAIPSISGNESAVAAFIEDWLRAAGGHVRRLGRNVVATAGTGPPLLFNSHFDTVPATEGWTRDPWAVEVAGGRVHGLGSNDAKASVAAMMGAYARIAAAGGPCELTLLLVCDEETGGEGAEVAWPQLQGEGCAPLGVVVGEPTGLDIAIAQKGLLVLELMATGDACHSANARRLGARNPIRALARDIAALEGVDLGEEHPHLGAATLEPTVMSAGKARNQVPAVASAFLDVRTVPPLMHEDYAGRVRQCLTGSEVRIVSGRLEPCQCPPGARIVRAAQAARPGAELFGSPTMSDMVFFHGVPAIKVGPGISARSHTADEFVLESEVVDGFHFYWRLVEEFARAGD